MYLQKLDISRLPRPPLMWSARRKGTTFFVGQVNSLSSLVELGMHMVKEHIRIPFLFLTPISLGVVVLPLPPVMALFGPRAVVRIFLRRVRVELQLDLLHVYVALGTLGELYEGINRLSL